MGRVVETETCDGSTPPSPWGSNTASSGVAKIYYNSEVQVQTDQRQKTRTLVYDALDRLVQVTDGAGTTYYAYDALDNLTYVKM
ncbi:MAG: RHS repeat protein [Bryobacterales bacterium]|nr:RHS repeat protein [Bryobacterales bacterium]